MIGTLPNGILVSFVNVTAMSLRSSAAKIIRPRLRPREAARRQPAVRSAAAGHPLRGIALQRVAPCQACSVTASWRSPAMAGRRPGARRPYSAGDPLGTAGFRRGRAPEGHSRRRKAQRSQNSNEFSKFQHNLAAMSLRRILPGRYQLPKCGRSLFSAASSGRAAECLSPSLAHVSTTR